MKISIKKTLSLLVLCFLVNHIILHESNAQTSFNFRLDLDPVNVQNLPGLHSYVHAQSNGKWLMIGGRTDGLHPRQPWASFSAAGNNTSIIVIDVDSGAYWSNDVFSLPAGISEQMQATNMSYYQDGDTLYIVGGYAYSPTAGDHITFDNLTTVQVSGLIDAIVNNTSITPFFKQISDSAFAVAGGQLGKIGDTFYLVGGHKFDGRYNPMNNPTFTQSYTEQIRKFKVNNSGTQLTFNNYSAITDPVHLHRRDYNLVPQIFPDRSEGYMISSGVFQVNADLPFLYPVNITAAGHQAIPGFNQYLSNYHSAKTALYDSTSNEMHSIFFGGMSQYYYQNGNLIQDILVPFVKTISRMSRSADSTLTEYQMQAEMPSLKGASAEFILNKDLPHYSSGIIKLDQITSDTILLGHIYGGIQSSALNPFSVNQTGLTSADPNIYAVSLIRDNSVSMQEIDGDNPYDIEVFPNPAESLINVRYHLDQYTDLSYFLVDNSGRIIVNGQIEDQYKGSNTLEIQLGIDLPPQILQFTMIFENKYFVTKPIHVH